MLQVVHVWTDHLLTMFTAVMTIITDYNLYSNVQGNCNSLTDPTSDIESCQTISTRGLGVAYNFKPRM